MRKKAAATAEIERKKVQHTNVTISTNACGSRLDWLKNPYNFIGSEKTWATQQHEKNWLQQHAAVCVSEHIFDIYIFIGTPTSSRLGDIHTRVVVFFLLSLHFAQHTTSPVHVRHTDFKKPFDDMYFFFGLNWVYFHFRSGLWNFLCEPRSTTCRWNTLDFNWFEFDGRRIFFSLHIDNFWDQWIFEYESKLTHAHSRHVGIQLRRISAKSFFWWWFTSTSHSLGRLSSCCRASCVFLCQTSEKYDINSEKFIELRARRARADDELSRQSTSTLCMLIAARDQPDQLSSAVSHSTVTAARPAACASKITTEWKQ